MILDMISGEDAWQMVFEANQFNDPPEQGMRYLIIRVQVGYIGLDEQGETIRDDAFFITTPSGMLYEPVSVVSPEPELFFELFPGGVVEGLVVFLVPVAEEGMALLFDPVPSVRSDFNRRYLSLPQSGR